MINPVLAAAFGSIVRWALALGSGYLIRAGIWTESEAATYVTAGALAATALLWSLWQKRTARLKLLTAAASRTPMSEAQIETRVKQGEAPPLDTPLHAIPKAPV